MSSNICISLSLALLIKITAFLFDEQKRIFAFQKEPFFVSSPVTGILLNLINYVYPE